MEPLRLDPADPFASVLAWLAALAQALGLGPAAAKVELNRASAALVRRLLAEWSRKLRRVIFAQAARLAATLRMKPRAVAHATPPTSARPRAKVGRMVAVAAPSRACPYFATYPAPRRDRAELIDRDEAAALKLRTRAVLMALHDPSAVIRRLARRLARRIARASAAYAAHRGRFPRPPRIIGSAFALSLAPELRPPNAAAAVCMQHAPRLAAAALQVLAGARLSLPRVRGRWPKQAKPAEVGGGGASPLSLAALDSSPARGGARA